MKKMNTYKTLIASAALLLTLPFISQAESPNHDQHKDRHEHRDGMKKGHRMHGGFPPFLKGLNLSAEQKTQVKAIIKAEKPKMKANHQKRKALKQEMQALASADRLDMAKAEQTADALGALAKETALNRMLIGNKIFAILTPEQRTQALKKMDKIHQRMQKKHAFNMYKEGRLAYTNQPYKVVL